MEDDPRKKFIFILFMYIKFIFFNPYLLYYVGYFVVSVFGLLNPICTSILLLDIFRRYPILLSILDSLWRPKKQLILTLLLFFLMTYYFALIYYIWYYSDLAPKCSNLWTCFIIMFDLTFKSDGGYIGFYGYDYRSGWNFSLKVFYDFLYIFLIIVLIL